MFFTGFPYGKSKRLSQTSRKVMFLNNKVHKERLMALLDRAELKFYKELKYDRKLKNFVYLRSY